MIGFDQDQPPLDGRTGDPGIRKMSNPRTIRRKITRTAQSRQKTCYRSRLSETADMRYI